VYYKTEVPVCLGPRQTVFKICLTANFVPGMKEDNLWYLPWVVRPDLLQGTQYLVSPSLGVIRRRRRTPLSTSVPGKTHSEVRVCGKIMEYTEPFEESVLVATCVSCRSLALMTHVFHTSRELGAAKPVKFTFLPTRKSSCICFFDGHVCINPVSF
jgi:hypothetical protein